MATLRLKQSTVRGKEYCVDLSLEGHGWFAHRAGACFTFDFGRREQEELRWYLEDFLQSPYAPAPQSAARIEGHIHDVGLEIFHKVFESSDDARKLWRAASARLEHTRIEIETGAGEGIPWELMVDPGTAAPWPLPSGHLCAFRLVCRSPLVYGSRTHHNGETARYGYCS